MHAKSTGIARRKLIAGGACALVGAGALAAPALKAALGGGGGETQDSAGNWWTATQPNLPRAGHDAWSREVGTSFLIGTEAGSLTATLTAVQRLNSKGERPDEVARETAFALVFDAGRSAAKGDRIYPVRHPAYGDFNIYFSPSSGSLLAVFN